MSERKNIEQLFQKKFENLEVSPDNIVWENLEIILKKKGKKRVIPLWWKLAGVASSLVLGVFIFNTYQDSEISKLNNTKQVFKENNLIKSNINSGVTSKSESKKSIEVDKSRFQNKSNYSTEKSVAEKSESKKLIGVDKSRFQNKSNYNKTSNVAYNEKVKSIEDRNSELQNNKNNLVKNIVVTDTKKEFEKSKYSSIKTNTETDNLVTQKENNQSLETKDIKKIDSTKIAIVEPNALEELLNEKEKVSKTESKINRWQVSSNLAPIYFNSVKNGSPLDTKLESNQKNYQTDKSYGIGVNYSVNKKVKIRAGLNILSIAYQTTGVVFYQDENQVSKIANLNPNVPGSLLVIESLTNVNSVFNKVEEKSMGSLNQKMGYLEVPLELSYKVLDKKFGINIIGGMSTLILNQNEIYLQSTGMNLKIGEANNLSQVHFSGNLGLGFKYGFMKHIEASVEPVFKYQINTFSNNVGSFKPYIFGIYSGISFSF